MFYYLLKGGFTMRKIVYITSLILLITNYFTGVLSVEAEELDSGEIVQLASSYTKTVTREWSTAEYYDNSTAPIGYKPIPRSVSYTERKNGQTYSGRLFLLRYYRAPGKYVATYSGTMYKSVSGPTPLKVPVKEK